MTGQLAILLLLGGAFFYEMLMRAVAKLGREPLWWHDRVTQRKEAQLHALSHRGGVDVVFIGTSMMLLGLDPARVTSMSGRRAYNASLYRGIPALSAAWLEDVVLQAARPELVVVGMCPFEVNDNGTMTTRLSDYRAAKVFRASPLLRFVRFFGWHCFAIRLLPMWKHPRQALLLVLEALRKPSLWRWKVSTEIPGHIGPLGEGVEFLDREYHNGPNMLVLIAQQAVHEYDNGGVQMDAYRRIVEINHVHGARTAFAAMPVARDFLDSMFVGGRERWELEWARLRALAQELGTPIIDVAREFEDTAFYADMVHMNRRGRDAFTARVVEGLIEAGLLPPQNEGMGSSSRPSTASSASRSASQE